MAYDVADRLGQGAAAVDDLATYLWAAHLRGYTHPDLTVHPMQLRDWYGTEDGLDLTVLETDCAGLRSALATAEQSLAQVQRQSAELSAAWQGTGAEAAANFLRRHCATATTLVAALAAAAQRAEALRAELWRIVDSKVADTIAVAERAGGQRAAWRSACAALLSGTAAEPELAVIDEQVHPFVAAAVGSDWIGMARAAVTAVAAAYREAGQAAALPANLHFEVPGWLGPVAEPAAAAAAPEPAPAVAAAPVATAPSGSVTESAASPPVDDLLGELDPLAELEDPFLEDPLASDPLVSEPLAGEALAAEPLAGEALDSGALPSLPTGLGDGLLDGLDPLGLPDLAAAEPLADGFEPPAEPAETEETEPEQPAGTGGGSSEPLPPKDAEPEDVEPDDAEPQYAAEQPVEPEPVAPEPVAPEPDPQIAAPLGADPDGSTPCEIAAEELPQAGQ